MFGIDLKNQLFLLFNLFLVLFKGPLHFLVLFMSHTVLFQLPFSFIYSTFSKKFSILTKFVVSKQSQTILVQLKLYFYPN